MKRIINYEFQKFILLIAIILSLCNCSGVPEKQPGMKTYVFKTIGHNKLKLYVFQPTRPQDEEFVAAIVFFHGGGFSGGKVSQFESQSKYLASRGMVSVLAEYRLFNRRDITPFECVEDAKSAIRWVRAHAKELGVDENRIAAAGGSAGGHLAASTALIKGFDVKTEDQNVSSAPNALVLFNPVLNLLEGFKKAVSKNAYEWLTKATEISPMHNLDKGAPPTIIFHGTADEAVPIDLSLMFSEEMKKLGNSCEVVAFEGRKHGFFNYHISEIDYHETMRMTENFLSSIGFLKGDTIINE